MATLSDQNFTGLRASIGDWIRRGDLTNTDYGNFIYLFEKDFNATLRVRGMEEETTIASTVGYLPHPTDWQAWKTISIVSGTTKYHLHPITEEQAASTYYDSDTDRPQGYVVRGNKTYLIPYPDGTYSYVTTYYKGVPQLGASSTTNWLLNQFPQCYLYGSLLQGQAFVADDVQVQKWLAAYNASMDNVTQESQKAQFLGGVPAMKPDRYF